MVSCKAVKLVQPHKTPLGVMTYSSTIPESPLLANFITHSISTSEPITARGSERYELVRPPLPSAVNSDMINTRCSQ